MKINIEVVHFEDLNAIEAQGRRAIDQGDSVFDFSAVKKADSAVLALLLQWLRRANQKGLQPEVINLPEGMWSLAKLYGVREIVRPYCKKSQ